MSKAGREPPGDVTPVTQQSIPRPFIDETMRLVGRALGAGRLAFYAVDARGNLNDFVLTEVPPDFHRTYERELFAFDPLHARQFTAVVPAVARLADAPLHAGADDIRTYRAFLRHFAVADTVELFFRDAHGIRAGLNVAWTDDDPAPTAATYALAEHLQRYIAFQLCGHLEPCTRPALGQAFGLTARERQVAQLVCEGHTNGVIAARLGVRVSTVKTHLLRAYEKCQVRTRAGLVGRLSEHASFQ